MRWLLYRIWCFSMIFGRFPTLPPWGVSVYIQELALCFKDVSILGDNCQHPQESLGGFLDWFSASGGPQGTKFRARWGPFRRLLYMEFLKWPIHGIPGVIFHPACRGYNSVYNWLIWLEPTLSVPLLVSNSNFACAKFSSCFCCQFETFDSQTSQRSLPRKCGW